MRPTEILKEEHRVIERALTALEAATERLEAGRDVPREVLENLLTFVRGFADGCHHRKEEDVLFPYLETRGMSRGEGPLGVMLAEHDVGRKHVRGMAEAVESGQPQAFAAHAQAYVALLRDHITKEDHVLFPMADQIMDATGRAEVVEAFERAEEELGDAHHKYLGLVKALEAALDVA